MVEEFRAACYKYRGASRSHEVKKASDYFLLLRSRPAEALQVSVAVLQARNEEIDVYLLASQLLVVAASKADVAGTAAVMQFVCKLASASSSECEWKSSPSVCSQVSLAVAHATRNELARLNKTVDSYQTKRGNGEGTKAILVGLQQNISNRFLYAEILGLLPEVLMRHRVPATAELHAFVAEILESEFRATVTALSASGESIEVLSFLCQILQSLTHWLDLVIDVSGESRGSENAGALYSQWLGIVVVNWSFDLLRNPQWLQVALSGNSAQPVVRAQREYYYKALELFSSVSQSVDLLPGESSMAYMEQCLSLVTQILTLLASASAEGWVGLHADEEGGEGREEGQMKSVLIMLCGCSSSLLSNALKYCSSSPADIATLSRVFTYFDEHLKGYLHFLASAPPSPSSLDLVACVVEDLCGSFSERLSTLTQDTQNQLSQFSPGLTTSAEEGVIQAVGLAIGYSALNQASCTVENDDTSEIGPRYDQGEGGQYRKRLRGALRSVSRAWGRLPVALVDNFKTSLTAFLAGDGRLWSPAEAIMHAVSAILKDLHPVSLLELLNLATHTRVMATRPLARFAVLIAGESVPVLVRTELPGAEGLGRGRAVNAAFSAVARSLLYTEEAPARLHGFSAEQEQGARLAFRLKEDHIGIVSLGRLLGCLPVEILGRDEGDENSKRRMAWALESVVSAVAGPGRPSDLGVLPEGEGDAAHPGAIVTMVMGAYWALLRDCLGTSPCFVGTTFKSFLEATEGMVGALAGGLREGYLLVPFLAALMRADQPALAALASCYDMDCSILCQVSVALEKLTLVQLAAVLTSCVDACTRAWGSRVGVVSMEYRAQMAEKCLLPALRYILPSSFTALSPLALESGCRFLLRVAKLLLAAQAPSERSRALPLLREIAALALSLSGSASTLTSAGGGQGGPGAALETCILLLTIWKDYASFLSDTGPSPEDVLLLRRVIPAVCGFLLEGLEAGAGSAESALLVARTPLNKPLFSLLLALLGLQQALHSAALELVEQGEKEPEASKATTIEEKEEELKAIIMHRRNNSLGDEGIMFDKEARNAVTRTLLVAMAVKACAADRELALKALRAQFRLFGSVGTMAMLYEALHTEPKVIAVSNKALKAFEDLAKAAERDDWKKFKNVARQLAK